MLARVWSWLSHKLSRRCAGMSLGDVSLGDKGERFADRYLRRLGYQVVARSERDLWGELDLIAVDRETIVFVEVKTRSSDAKGSAAEAVDRDKQRRVTRQAVAFLKRHQLLEYAVRFDILALTWPDGARRPSVLHLKDAFEPVGCRSFFS